MTEGVAILLVMMMLLMAAVVLIVVSMINRRHLREMAHRERLAMIERGLVPSPERDPARFEAASGLAPAPIPTSRAARGERYRTAGVAMMGIGAGLVMLIGGVGGRLDVAIGVGGAWVMLGAALLLNYFLMNRGHTEGWPPASGHRDHQPPPNVAP